MRTNPNLFTKLLVIVLAGAMVVFQTGCKKKSSNPDPPSQGAAQKGAEEATVPPQGEGVTILRFENDPTKRPLVTSQPAKTAREWELQALRQGYADTGRTNASWDAKANHTFELYAALTHDGDVDFDTVYKAAQEAKAAGCDDPLIQYMIFRYDPAPHDVRQAVNAAKAHDGVVRSRYHPVFKYRAGMRALHLSRIVDPKGSRGQLQGWTITSMEDFARDTNAPLEDVIACALDLVEYAKGKEWHTYACSDLLPIMEKNWGKSEPFFVFMGEVEIHAAWADRGNQFANKVTDAGWEGMAKHLQSAEGYLTKAWQMNPKRAETAYNMMRVELGQGEGRPRMELWFNRAMSLATNYYNAAKSMSYYLEPRWYGDEATCLTFARSCVSSPKWGGEVPLVLVETHRSLAAYYKLNDSPQYWQRPQVWKDVKSAYEKFFKLNPEATGWRHNYALDAYTCGQYSDFLKQTTLFTERTNYAFFGGEQKFQEMLKKAVASTGGKSP